MNPSSAMAVELWLTAVLFAVVLAGVGAAKVAALKRRRAERTRALEEWLADLLVADSTVTGLSVGASVRLPLWRVAPVLVVLRGHVPSPYLRDAVREVIRRNMAIAQDAYYLDDRLVVVGHSPIRHAA